jgi:putative metalloprotease
MKKIITLTLALTAVCAGAANAQIRIGGKTLNTGKLIEAATNTVTAYTLTDADVAMLCRDAVVWMDENNQIADQSTDYGQRLARLTANLKSVNGIPLNFKVYHVTDVNAFACGDGSIRVFSALMDVMDDDELMAIIGHEVGHVANGDTRDAMKTAYKVAAAKSLMGSVDGSKLAKFTSSEWADLSTALIDSQFSQKQEFEADDYGFRVCVENGFSPYGMAESLERLVELFESGGQQATLTQKMFSSHPDSKNRARRMREEADGYVKLN